MKSPATSEPQPAVTVASKSAELVTTMTMAPILANSAVPMAPKAALEKEHAAKMAAKAAIAAARARTKLQAHDASKSPGTPTSSTHDTPEASISSLSPPSSPPEQSAEALNQRSKRSIANVDAPEQQQAKKPRPGPAQASPKEPEEPELPEPVFIPYGDYSVPILYAETIIHRDDRLLNDPSLALMDEAVYLLDVRMGDIPKREAPKKEHINTVVIAKDAVMTDGASPAMSKDAAQKNGSAVGAAQAVLEDATPRAETKQDGAIKVEPKQDGAARVAPKQGGALKVEFKQAAASGYLGKKKQPAKPERGFLPQDLGRPNVRKKGPTVIIDNCDLWLHNGQVHVATEQGLLLAATYLTLGGIPDTTPVRFEGTKPTWLKELRARRNMRKIVQVCEQTNMDVLYCVPGDVVEVYDAPQEVVHGMAWGRKVAPKANEEQPGWIPVAALDHVYTEVAMPELDDDSIDDLDPHMRRQLRKSPAQPAARFVAKVFKKTVIEQPKKTEAKQAATSAPPKDIQKPAESLPATAHDTTVKPAEQSPTPPVPVMKSPSPHYVAPNEPCTEDEVDWEDDEL
jgi:hypothetical protein